MPPGQDVPTGHGVIEGIVVDAATHEPLKKVKVTMGVPRQTPPMASTDASGRFVFRELPAGGYWLNASKSGYNAAQDPLGAGANLQVNLGQDETKKGIEIALVPGGSISGRILNEDGLATRNCSVEAVQPGYEQGKRTLTNAARSTGTDDKGEYRISNVAPGRYYLFVNCHAELPAPHPLLPHGDPRTPHDTYLPQFYGGGLDPAGATKVAVAAGANLEGIDFELRRTRAVALRGNITTADPEGFPDNVNVTLYPANPLMQNVMQFGGASANSHNRTFQIRSVTPGSYRLVAFSRREGHAAYAERTVEIGATQPEPIELALSTGADLKGTVQLDSDDHPPIESAVVFMTTLGAAQYVPQPHAEINKDGTFTLAGVTPGHWRLMVRPFGYVKSLSLAGQQVLPYDFQIPPGATGPLQVTVGMKTGDISVTVTGLSGGGQASLLVFPEDLDRLGTGLERVAMGSGQVGIGGLPPGHYRLLATDAPNPWMLQQRPDLLKAIESSTQAIDLPEGGHVSATVEVVSREELLRLVAEKEQ
jgi:Carboxypeptidase regulatory-like domain